MTKCASCLTPNKCSKFSSFYCFYCCFWIFKCNYYSVDYIYVVRWKSEGVCLMLNNDYKWSRWTKCPEEKCDSKANLSWTLTRLKQIFGCSKQHKHAHDQTLHQVHGAKALGIITFSSGHRNHPRFLRCQQWELVLSKSGNVNRKQDAILAEIVRMIIYGICFEQE